MEFDRFTSDMEITWDLSNKLTASLNCDLYQMHFIDILYIYIYIHSLDSFFKLLAFR
jgi:hypothetical protein